jgi:hypothetical protein
MADRSRVLYGDLDLNICHFYPYFVDAADPWVNEFWHPLVGGSIYYKEHA